MKSKKIDINNWSYKSLLIILFFLLISIVVLWKFVLPNHKVQASWWNDGWNYRKAISIGNSGATTTNQYVKITIDTANLITAGKLKNNCDDIRVTNINGKLLTHFIDGNATYACNTNQTSIYVLVDSIPTSGSTIYLYYGNSSATNVEPQLGTQQNPAISCKNILQHRSDNKGNQKYYITPTGNIANSIQVTCDMTYSSGGWIQVWHGLPSEAFVNDSTHETVNLSNNIIFNDIRVEGTNLNFSVIDTVTQTAMLGSSIRTYFNQVHLASDASNPKVNFHNLSGTQNITLTNNYFMYGYGNGYRFFYTCIDVSGINDYYTGGGTPTCTPRSSFNPTSVGCASVDYCSNARNTTPVDSGLHLSLYQYQESSVYVRETAIILNISQSMGAIATEEAGGGPIAYWKFDEGVGTTAYDSSSNQNNGVFGAGNSAPTWADESQCISGKCLKFDGSNDYINANNSNALNIQNNTITLSLWTKYTSTSGWEGLLYKDNGNGMGYQLFINSSNQIAFGIYTTSFTRLTYNTAISQNTWHHIEAVYDGSNMKIYLDGSMVTSTPKSGNIADSSSRPLLIGKSTITGENFNGFIDDIKIYPYARTADQIKKDYNSRGASSQGTSANLGSAGNDNNLSDGLVGYWKMDEGVGISILDSSGTGTTGTFTSASWSSGKFGVGGSFPGSVYANLGTNIVNQTAYTKSVWIKTNTQNANNIFSGGSGGHVLYAQSGNLYLSNTWNSSTISVATNFYDNNWHFITATYDGTKGILYMDGIKLGETNMPNIPASQPAYIGAYAAGNQFIGLIDEVRLYSRALSPAEVSQLYEFAPGPVGYWGFDDGSGSTAKDKSGNNLNGSFSGAPTWSQGKYGSALYFDGSDDSVNISHNSLLEPKSITVGFWAKLKSDGTRHVLVTKWSGFTTEVTSGGVFQWGLNGPSGQYFGTKTIPYDQWIYLTGTFDDQTKQQCIYFNGIQQECQTPTGSISYSQGTLQFSWSHEAHGTIDDVKIYNYARTQKQIIEDMSATGRSASGRNAIGYYKFDEGSGGTVYNFGIGGTALNGTFGTGNSAPTWVNEGKSGKALNFNNSYTYVTTSTSILNNSNQFSASAWVKSNNTSQDQTIFSANPPFFLRLSGGKFRIGLYTNSSWTFVNGNIPLNNNIWYHLLLTYDGSTLKSYVNGQLDTNTSKTGVLSSFGTIFVGYPYVAGENYPFNGLIDEVKIYNYALTSDEVKQDYNAGSALQMGQTSQTIGNTTTSLEYCIPGDTSYCTSPIAEYKLDEGSGTSANDTSGNNNTVSLENSPSWAQGKIGKSIQLNGSNQRGNAGNNINATNITIESWVYRTSNNTNQGIVRKDPIYALSLYNNTIQVAPGNSWTFYDTGISLPLNTWTHIAWAYNGTLMKVYINGQFVWSYSLTGTLPTNSNPTYIGYDANGWWFGGKIDQIKIYNYARTPAQIAYDYNKGGPVGWWKLDECQGNIAYDWSGIGNTGTIIIGASGTQNSLGTCSIGTSAAWTNGATGKLNSSLNFDGTDDYIDTSNQVLKDNSPFTYSIWIKFSSSQTAKTIMGRHTNAGGGSSIGIDDSSANKIKFHLNDYSTQRINSTMTLNDNTWHHITGTWDGVNLKLYVDGKLNTSSTPSSTLTFPLVNTQIGRWVGGASQYFNGQIDDARIYNYALTPEQVKTLYNNGAVSFN